MRGCAALLLTLALGGCALSGLVPDWSSDDAAGPEPTNYRFIVANGLDRIMGDKDPNNRLLEITASRRVNSTKGASWMVCVRALRHPSRLPSAHYAVFIQRDKIAESRLSVVVDQCESQAYSPFEWKADIDRPVLSR
jgi:hypothetical protein